MREETHESLRRLFEQVIDLPPGERRTRLDRECAPSLRPRLEAMLSAAESDDGFLADPPPDAAPAFEAVNAPVREYVASVATTSPVWLMKNVRAPVRPWRSGDA